MAASSHMWILNNWNVASKIKEQNFKLEFYYYLIEVKVKNNLEDLSCLEEHE